MISVHAEDTRTLANDSSEFPACLMFDANEDSDTSSFTSYKSYIYMLIEQEG